MTPRSIDTGRALSSSTSAVTIADGATGTLATARGDRVALSVAVAGNAFPSAILGVTVGIVIGGALVPLTALTIGHPACYLSVDKIGSAVCAEIRATNLTGGSVTLGVTDVRQTQPWSDE